MSRLLFDENLSRHLPRLLREEYPESLHVSDLGLLQTADREIWRVAAEQGLTITIRDADFTDLALRLGSPPKVIRLYLPNAPTSMAVTLLKASKEEIDRFVLADGPRVLNLDPRKP